MLELITRGAHGTPAISCTRDHQVSSRGPVRWQHILRVKYNIHNARKKKRRRWNVTVVKKPLLLSYRCQEGGPRKRITYRW